MSEVGDVLDLTVERPAFGGDVIAHAPDGRVVFVRGAAPGDRVRVEITRARRRHLKARRLEVLETGPRAIPFCEHFERCGGCPWMAIPLRDQRETLRAHVSRALDVEAPAIEATADRGWRSTARMHWRDGVLGYHAHGSDALVEVEACPVLAPEVARLHAAVRSMALAGEGTLRLTAAPGAASGTVAVERGRLPLAGFVERTPACHGARVGRETYGVAYDLFEGVRHPAGSFVQAHRPGNAALVAAVTGALEGEARVLELYAGSGNFTFALAERGVAVTAVESDPRAASALREEAARRGLPVVVREGDAARPPRGGGDVALLDPPRSGAREAVAALHEAGVRRIAYVSCDPGTLGRDVAWLRERGWRADVAEAFDLFPHTGHVEVLALLERTKRE